MSRGVGAAKGRYYGDRYEKAVAYLEANPEELTRAYRNPHTHPGGPLFLYCTPTGKQLCRPLDGRLCGCPTQVAGGYEDAWEPTGIVAWTWEMTRDILDDPLVPRGLRALSVKCLGRLAYWQRRLDREIPRSRYLVANSVLPLTGLKEKET